MDRQKTLDPDDWGHLRAVWQEAARCGLDYLEHIRSQPAWRPVPPSVLNEIAEDLPWEPQDIADVVGEFRRNILPYGTGNTHPAFFGWVHGGGNVYGAMGEMLAALMNSNVGGRDHIAVYIERQVLQWCRQIFAFPDKSSAILTSGTSMSTLIALAVARNKATGMGAKHLGLAEVGAGLVGYCSQEAHHSVTKAFQLLGLGDRCLRSVPVDESHAIDVRMLDEAIAEDLRAGRKPFCAVATVGSANTGAIDDVEELARICRKYNLWLHTDAAFGGFAIFREDLRKGLSGITNSDSVAFDFHKWLQVPYDAGGVLIKDSEAHRASFSERKEYVQSTDMGLAGGEPWFCDFGPEMSRGFRALKIWFTIKTCGMSGLVEVVEKTCEQASYLAERIHSTHPTLELLAPVALNICCFRYVPRDLSRANAINGKIVVSLQNRGIAAPSVTTIDGKTAIRVAVVNHRTARTDLDMLIEAVLQTGHAIES